LLQTFDRFIDVSHLFLEFTLNLSLRYYFIFCLLFNKFVNIVLFLLLKWFKLDFTIVENFLNFWIQVLQILLELSFHQWCIFLIGSTLWKNFAQFSLITELNCQVWMLIHFFNKRFYFRDIINAFSCWDTSYTTLSGWVNNST